MGQNPRLICTFADHWNADNLGASTYSFYPVVADAIGLSLHETGGWTLNAAAGTWSDLPYTAIMAANSTTPESALVECDDSCPGGLAVNMTSTNNFSFTRSGSAGKEVLGI